MAQEAQGHFGRIVALVSGGLGRPATANRPPPGAVAWLPAGRRPAAARRRPGRGLCPPGHGLPARPRRRPPGSLATAPPWPPGPSPPTPSSVAVPGGAPFFGHPLQAGRHRRQTLVQL